mgnify:FL=1
MYHVYIIFSEKAKKFYIGQTMDIEKRILQHNTAFFEDCSTIIATDWELFYQIDCSTRKQAILIERHIKKMKSRKYLEDLKKYPEITEKLLSKYKTVNP